MRRRSFAGGTDTVNFINGPGNVTRFKYDGLDRLVRREVFLTEDGKGNGVAIGASATGLTDSPAHPESRKPLVDNDQGGGDGVIRTGYVYDANSNVVSQVDDQGNATVYLFDNLDRVIGETYGVTTTSELSVANLLTPRVVPTPTASTIENPATIADAKLNDQLNATEVRLQALDQLFPSLADSVSDPTTRIYGYNPDDELLIVEDENDSEFYRDYDAVGRLIHERVFRAGQADSHAADALFAPVPVNDPSNSNVTTVVGSNARDYEYDGLSRVVVATDNNEPAEASDDSQIIYAYDSMGRVIEESQSLGTTTHVVDYAWRADDLLISTLYPNGRAVTYTYDGLDRRVTTSDAGGETLTSDAYIGTWRLLSRQFGNDTELTYLDALGTSVIGYDGLRRVVDMRHVQDGNNLLVGFSHNYDRANNRITEEKLHDSANDEVYTYDSAYRLTEFGRSGNSGDTITPQHQAFELDGTGNWTTVDGESRDHSNFNELVVRDNGDVTLFVYDDNGNQTSNGHFEFFYDSWNRLDAVQLLDGTTVAEYDYDAMNRRVEKDVSDSGAGDGTTRYYYDGWQVIEERDAGDAVTQQYVYGTGIDEVLVMDRNLNGGNSATSAGDQRLYFHQNSLWSTYGLSDDSGALVEGYLYDAYGRTTTFAGGNNGTVDFGIDDVVTVNGTSLVDNPYLFTGRRLDNETGMHYYRNRFYSSDDGRFLHRDPMGVWFDSVNVGNGYAYVGNNSINMIDPLGQKSWWQRGISAVGSAVGHGLSTVGNVLTNGAAGRLGDRAADAYLNLAGYENSPPATNKEILDQFEDGKECIETVLKLKKKAAKALADRLRRKK